MNQSRRPYVVVAGLLITLWVSCAFANGINPPRPRDAVTVKAMCTTNHQPNVKEVFRARISGVSEFSESLHLRIDGAIEEASLEDIMSIRFVSSKVDSNGYLAAKIVRRGSGKDELVSVQVQTGKADVALAGFSGTGSAVKVRLKDCAIIDFSSSADSSKAPDHPASKK